MEKGNVLVIGGSGVGKSTLINAVLGEEIAKTGWGTKGTTEELEIYENEEVPFRLIDTIGFEPLAKKQNKAIKAVKRLFKKAKKEGYTDTQISAIWFCVDGTVRKLFPEDINHLAKATSMWKSAPVIVVLTKSYSEQERQENIEMVNHTFAMDKSHSINLRRVIPVVASTFKLNENAYAPPEGITELIDVTNQLLPEGIRAGQEAISSFNLKRKRALAQGVVWASTMAGATVGAIPIPFPDALVLTPIEIAEINAIASIYGINKNEESKHLFNSIIGVGAISQAAKGAINALKAIPGINLGASALNSIVAGSIIAALGGGVIYVFEQIYLGKKSVYDLEWVKEVIEEKFSPEFLDVVKDLIENITENMDNSTIAKKVFDAFKKNFIKTNKAETN